VNGETAKVIQLPSRGGEEIVLTKKQLAARLKRSERWVEIKVRDEGLPVLAETDRFGRRRYSLKAVEDWMGKGKPKPKPAKREDRLTLLEQQVRDLQAQLNELRRAS
jgi:hypothetical protein